MKKDESIKFRMVGHDKTAYKSIELMVFADTCFIFKVTWKHVEDYGMYWIPLEAGKTFGDVLNELLELISESENQESEFERLQKARSLPLLFC